MTSVSAPGQAGNPSFAKIAAANVKPSASTQQNPTAIDKAPRQDITSSPRNGACLVSPSIDPAAPVHTSQNNAVSAAKQNQQARSVDMSPPQVRIRDTAATLSPGTPIQPLQGTSTPAPSEEASTQLSSSASDLVKPPSLDGKSVASGTTFALDEKESLRPDDSASVKATDDEDIFSPPSTGLPDSRGGSDDSVRAFREQLREISGMEPSRRPGPAPNFGQVPNPHQGILYVPPQGPGVGTVPGSIRSPLAMTSSAEVSPDPRLLEALDSPKDRIMVLKLEQDILDFVKDPKETSLKLPQTNAFYRMLAHRLADYYMLGHGVDESTQAVRIFKTPNCRVPPPLTDIATPSTAASTPPPLATQMKILRRGENVGPGNGSNMTSKTTSENGESGEDDKRPKAPVSREEREARYEAARKRIMGSAKPSPLPDDTQQKDPSRPGSTTGKKTTKKQRADSDDDFEARSAYSAYYPPSFSPAAPANQSYGMPGFAHSANQMTSGSFANQDASTAFQQVVPHGQGPWQGQAYQKPGAQPSWAQNQHHGYDIATEFQRAMSFRPQMSLQPPNGQQTFNSAYNGQYYGQQQAWPQQNFQMPSQAPATGYPYMPNFQNRPPSSSGQPHENQPYAYGQLPSQTFPGRPSSKLEHPLPGSYTSKHFNPQSQSFTPGQSGNVMNSGPSVGVPGPGPQLNSPGHVGGYASNTPIAAQQQHQHQQSSSFQHSPAYGSPQPTQQPSTPARLAPQPSPSSQQLTHPLPQPVFPRQPSPNVPLPPRPDAAHPPSTPSSAPAPPSFHHDHQPQSSIAKWGAPASLPPKPPPSAEPFSASKFAHAGVVGSSGGVRGLNGLPSTLPPPPPQPSFGVVTSSYTGAGGTAGGGGGGGSLQSGGQAGRRA